MSRSWSGSYSVEHESVDEERRSDVLKLVLYDLNSAIAPREHRLLALEAALTEFDHDEEVKHDEELDLHADKILLQKLAFAFQVDREGDELAMVCSALEMVYRASRTRVSLSFSELRESILPIFVDMLGKPVHLRRQEEIEQALQDSEGKELENEQDSYTENGASYAENGASYAENGASYAENGSVWKGGDSTSQINSQPTKQPIGKDDDSYQSIERNTPYEVETVRSQGSENQEIDDHEEGLNMRGPGREKELETLEEGQEERSNYSYEESSLGKPPKNSVSEKQKRLSTDSSSVAKSLRAQLREREKLEDAQMGLSRGDFDLTRVERPTHPTAVGRCLQVLRYFSRVLSAMVPMAHYPGLLDALVYQLELQPYGRYASVLDEHDDMDPRIRVEGQQLTESRIDGIATMVNLACAEENKAMMANHNGLLDAIIQVALKDPAGEAREYAAIVVMNLAYADENKVMMVKRDGLLDTLVHLITDKSPFTRRYASAAMFTLACVVANTERMASHCNGAVLEALRHVLAEDPVDEARINASEALFNMARNNTEATVALMGEHLKMLETLARAILTDYSADVRIYCARALEWMSADVHHPMKCHGLLLSALTAASQWTKTSCIAEAMKVQATLAENRRVMAAHGGLLDALSDLAILQDLNDADTRMSAVAALEMISREPEARRYMVQNERVMTALTKASFDIGEDDEEMEDESGDTTSRLVKSALKNLVKSM